MIAFTFIKGKEVYKLKDIMRYCKTKILAMPIPSTDDVAQIKAEKVMEDIAGIIENENLKDMIEIGNEYGAKWYTVGKRSVKGHPHHPLYLKNNSTLDDFDIRSYINNF